MATTPIRTIYLRNLKTGLPEGLLAYQGEGTTLRVAFTLHNPTDRWDRKQARAVVLARMDRRRLGKGDRHYYFEFPLGAPLDPDYGPYEVLAMVALQFAITHQTQPSRFGHAQRKVMFLAKQMVAENLRRHPAKASTEPAPASQAEGDYV